MADKVKLGIIGYGHIGSQHGARFGTESVRRSI